MHTYFLKQGTLHVIELCKINGIASIASHTMDLKLIGKSRKNWDVDTKLGNNDVRYKDCIKGRKWKIVSLHDNDRLLCVFDAALNSKMQHLLHEGMHYFDFVAIAKVRHI